MQVLESRLTSRRFGRGREDFPQVQEDIPQVRVGS